MAIKTVSSNREHHVVFIPGIGDQYFGKYMANAYRLFWDLRGFPLHIVGPTWSRGSYEPKQELVLGTVDDLTNQGLTTSIVGVSAGDSLGGNVFCLRKERVKGFINVTGRSRVGDLQNFFEATKRSAAFAESVRRLEINQRSLTDADRRRIMTIRPTKDDVVPAETVAIEGATNLVAPFEGHNLGAIFIMTRYARVLQDFLRGLE